MMGVCVFRFRDVAPEVQAMSPHGGDEDWVIIGLNEQLVRQVTDKLDVCGDAHVVEDAGVWYAITSHS